MTRHRLIARETSFQGAVSPFGQNFLLEIPENPYAHVDYLSMGPPNAYVALRLRASTKTTKAGKGFCSKHQMEL